MHSHVGMMKEELPGWGDTEVLSHHVWSLTLRRHDRRLPLDPCAPPASASVGCWGLLAPVEQISRSWRHRGKICVSPSDSWTFTAQIPQVIHRTCCTSVLGSFWGNNDVITFWIYLNLNTCSCQPPASTLNKARTCPSTLISMSSKFEVCSAWNASFIGSF